MQLAGVTSIRSSSTIKGTEAAHRAVDEKRALCGNAGPRRNSVITIHQKRAKEGPPRRSLNGGCHVSLVLNSQGRRWNAGSIR